MTPSSFLMSDLHPPITITPRRLSSSSLTLTPQVNDVKKLGLDVAFLVGKTTPESAPNTPDESKEGKAKLF